MDAEDGEGVKDLEVGNQRPLVCIQDPGEKGDMQNHSGLG